jgi:hypothetical protein
VGAGADVTRDGVNERWTRAPPGRPPAASTCCGRRR